MYGVMMMVFFQLISSKIFSNEEDSGEGESWEEEEERTPEEVEQDIRYRAALFIPFLGAGCMISYLIVYLIVGIVVAFKMRIKSVKVLYPIIYTVYGAIRGVVMGLLLGCCCALVFRTSNILSLQGDNWTTIPLSLGVLVVAVNIFLNFFKKF